MSGILIAIFASFIQSIGDVGKKRLSQLYHPYLVNWIPLSIGVVLNLTIIGLTGIPTFDLINFLSCLLLAVILLVIVEIRFVKALTSGDLSLVMPFGSFIPIINTAYAWVLFGEEPSSLAFVGIIIIFLGSWVMFSDLSKSGGLLAPLKAVFTQPGPRHMLILALWNGLFVLFMKMGSLQSSAMFFFTMVIVGELCVFSFLLLKEKINPLIPFKENLVLCLQTGIFWTIGLTMFFYALSITLVAYASAAQRTHAIFVVLLSHFLLKEGEIKKRLLGCVIMVLGVILILLPS